MAKRINSEEFEILVKHSQGVVIVDFYTDFCVPCKKLAPVLGDFEDEYEDKLTVYKLNAAFDTDPVDVYNVTATPTLILFKDGEEQDRKIGIMSLDELKEWAGEYI